MKKLETPLLILFLLTVPLSIRKVFLYYPLTPGGPFNEYTDLSLYLSDIAFAAFFLSIIINNKYNKLSINNLKRMFHVEHLRLYVFPPVLLVLWAFLSTLWVKSVPLALYSSLKLLEGYAVYLSILFYIVPRGTFMQSKYLNANQDQMFHVEHLSKDAELKLDGISMLETIFLKIKHFLKQPYALWLEQDRRFINTTETMFHVEHSRISKKCSTWNKWMILFTTIITIGFIQALIATLQFVYQRSLGITFFKESIISATEAGVAKVVLGNNVFIRAYGLFPHPNVLGGFLALSVLITMVYPLLIQKTNGSMFHVEHLAIGLFYRLALFVQIFALLLTFSKSAITAVVIALAYFYYELRKMFHVEHSASTKQVSQKKVRILASHKNKQKMFHVEHLALFFVSATVFILALFKAINIRYFLVQPLSERLFLGYPLMQILEQHPFKGLGSGQFVGSLQSLFGHNLDLWQFQPIHNVYLLIFSELGFIGLALFLLFLIILFRNVPRGTFAQEKLLNANQVQMFHVEHSVVLNDCSQTNVPRGTFYREKILSTMLIASMLILLWIMLFDHYLWDIQQGQLLFWIIAALLVASKFTKEVDTI